MGWYHDAGFKWENQQEGGGSGTTTPTPAADTAASSSPPSSVGHAACPLPPAGAPPPPPPDVKYIYHLAQKSKWQLAKAKREPYFPPTFVKDGKFTRATVFQKDLVGTANQYYKDSSGDWIVLEIDVKLLYALGIPILAQQAPESTPQQPVTCVQIFGGISTTLPGLVTHVYPMKRATDGTFVQVMMESKKAEGDCGCGTNGSGTTASAGSCDASKQQQEQPLPEQSKPIVNEKEKPRRFWQRK